MYKKLAIILLAVNLVVSGLFINRHMQNLNIRRDLLGQYIVAQHNISTYMNDAAGYYRDGNTEDFVINLHKTAGEFQAVDYIISPGSLLGQHTEASGLMYTIHSSQKDFVSGSLEKVVTEELSEEDSIRIISFAAAMKHYADLLDYYEIIPGSRPDQIVSRIDEILGQVSQAYGGSEFER